MVEDIYRRPAVWTDLAVLILVPGFMRWRVICINPNFVIGRTVRLALSSRMNCPWHPPVFFFFSISFMSMKIHDDDTTKVA